VFGERGGIGVIAHQHRVRETFFKDGLKWLAAPAEVGGAQHDTCEVDYTGRSNADAEHREGRCVEERLDEVGYCGCGIRTGSSFYSALTARKNLAVEVEYGATEDPIGAQVDTDDLKCLTVDVEECCGFAWPGVFALACFDDEPFDDELSNKVGDGYSREPGLSSDIGTTALPCAIQRLQNERAVVATSVFGQNFGARAECTSRGEAWRAPGSERCRWASSGDSCGCLGVLR